MQMTRIWNNKKTKIFECQIIKKFMGAKKTKGPNTCSIDNVLNHTMSSNFKKFPRHQNEL